MFFFWPTINDMTLSGERRERQLRDLESRMDAFLTEKGGQACPQVVANVRRSRSEIRREARRTITRPEVAEQHKATA